MNNRTRLRSEDVADQSSNAAKRQKMTVSNAIHTASYQREDYTVSWICALHIEAAAARAMLDYIHDDLPGAPNDINTYIFGNIGHHNIVIASLPAGYYGMNNAATVASNIERSFPSIEIHLMVGIGGGAPGKLDLRLGDIVVGSRVMQYDLGKIVSGQIERTGFPIIPPPKLLTYITKLRAIHELKSNRVPAILQEMHNKYPQMTTYARPIAQDRLFRADFEHNPAAASCDECDASKLVHRLTRTNPHPKIHYEAIASSNQVMKHGLTRDKIAQELQAACFEMEAAGLVNFPYLIIRGICDYSDSHKNKQWQQYAAAVAAAYAKEFLEAIPIAGTKVVAATDVQLRNGKLMNTSLTDGVSLQNKRKKFLDSLKFEQIDFRQLNIKTAYTATCKWFLKSPLYLEWIDPAKLSEHHGVLWLSGKPGAGKSTIMKFAYIHVQKTLHSDAVISFFFNARGEALERSTTGMYRSLLFQLFERFPDLEQAYDDSNCYSNNDSCPPLDVIQTIFRKAISLLGQRSLTCFIDALDECDELQVRDMVEYFEALGQQAVEDKIELRICFSSRHYPYIYIRQGLRLTLENQKGHEEDVEKYVQGNLRADPGPLLEEIRAQILQKAAGVFMWVVLVVDILNKEFSRGRMFAVKKRLAEIPNRLSDLFKDILKRDNENMEDLLLCLQWILYAKRPLIREEFYFAISAGLLGEDEDTADYLMSSISSDMMDRFVVSSSKGLAEVTKSDQNTVQFIHESVRDFLIKDNGIQELWPEFSCDFEYFSHDKLKQCCYNYMKLDVSVHVLAGGTVPKEKDAMKKLRGDASEKYPFLQYATQHILYHADIAASSIPQDNFLAEFKLDDWITLSNVYEKYKVRRYTPKASLFYILADKGFSALIQTNLRYDPECYTLGERYRYPLFTAIINGHSAAVQTLLSQDASYTEDTKSHPIYKSEASFAWAVDNGHERVVQLLVTKGANVNAKDRHARNILLAAFIKDYPNIAKLLVEKGADVNTKTEAGNSALAIALERGYPDIAKLLIEKGADVNAETSLYAPVLYVAIKRGYTDIAKLLVEKGADINAKNIFSSLALCITLEMGYTDIAKLLVEKGADVNAKNISGISVLCITLERGYPDIAKLLVEKGADVNSKNSSGTPVLCIALERGYPDVAKLLVEKGADVNSKNSSGTPVLCITLERGYTDITKLLVEKGADVNAKINGQTGEAALWIAFMHKKDDIVRLLIENGAKLIIRREMLFQAVWGGDENIVKLLIENGADVNAKDTSGETVLWTALIREHDDILQLLLKNGADIKNNHGQKLLSKAIWMGRERIVRILIDNGADINMKEANGRTALLAATKDQNMGIIQLLLDNGADINARDNNGRTALLVATWHKDKDIMKLLIEKGADFNTKDIMGRTALQQAFINGHGDIVELLIKKGADSSSIRSGETTVVDGQDTQ